MRRRPIATALAALAGVLAGLLGTPVAASAQAREDLTALGEMITPAPVGTRCYDRTLPDGAGVTCWAIDPGVQVRVVLDREGEVDVASTWLSETGVFHTVTAMGTIRGHRVEFRADPSGAGSACSAWIVKTKDRTAAYDEHAVRATCSTIAGAVKVRGGADYTAQSDTHTAWFTAPGVEHQSPGQTRTVPAMPVAFLEYGLVDY